MNVFKFARRAYFHLVQRLLVFAEVLQLLVDRRHRRRPHPQPQPFKRLEFKPQKELPLAHPQSHLRCRQLPGLVQCDRRSLSSCHSRNSARTNKRNTPCRRLNSLFLVKCRIAKCPPPRPWVDFCTITLPERSCPQSR